MVGLGVMRVVSIQKTLLITFKLNIMKTTIALLLIILSFSSITLTSCEVEYAEPCYNCGGGNNTGNNNGGNNNTAPPIEDRIVDAPETENFYTQGDLLIQNGGKWADYNDWINAANGNYIAVRLTPTIQTDGSPRTTGAPYYEQFYTIVADEELTQ